MKEISAEAKKIVEFVEGKKGRFVHVEWVSRVKPKAASKSHTLTKKTRAVVRMGIDYANLKSVKEGIANGERGEVESLPWGEWLLAPIIIGHHGVEYVRMYPHATAIPKVQYFVNGLEVEKEKFQEHLTPSQLVEKEDRPACITKRLDEIEILGDYEAEEVVPIVSEEQQVAAIGVTPGTKVNVPGFMRDAMAAGGLHLFIKEPTQDDLQAMRDFFGDSAVIKVKRSEAFNGAVFVVRRASERKVELKKEEMLLVSKEDITEAFARMVAQFVAAGPSRQ